MTNTLEPLTATTISRLRVPELDELPDELRAQLESLGNQLGYIPNWARVQSRRCTRGAIQRLHPRAAGPERWPAALRRP